MFLEAVLPGSLAEQAPCSRPTWPLRERAWPLRGRRGDYSFPFNPPKLPMRKGFRRPRILVRMMGGLGNQLFQYAAAYSLALRLGLPLVLDLGWYQENPQRSFALRSMGMLEPACGFWERLGLKMGRRFPWMEPGICRFLLGTKIFRERSFAYDPSFQQIREGVYLDGYWQSQLYFQGAREVLAAHLAPAGPVDGCFSELQNSLAREDSLAVHVRRGDYLTDPTFVKIYASCSSEYYRQAVAILSARTAIRRVFIFGEDVAWARSHLRLNLPTTWVDPNQFPGHHHDLWLLAACPNLVMANSTFSWWAAWLLNERKKNVIAPRKWFLDPNLSTKDLYDPYWELVEN